MFFLQTRSVCYTAMCSVIRVTVLLYVSNAYIGLVVIPWPVFGGFQALNRFTVHPVSDLSWLTMKKLLPSLLNSLTRHYSPSLHVIRHYVISAFEIESLNKLFMLG